MLVSFNNDFNFTCHSTWVTVDEKNFRTNLVSITSVKNDFNNTLLIMM